MASRKDLLEQYEDAQFALLMDEIMELEGAELEKCKQQLLHDPAMAVPPEVRRRSLETINREFDKRDRAKKRRGIRTAFRTLLIAAVVTALLLGTVSADFRTAARNFVIQITELAAEIMFLFDDDTAQHQGEYIMGYFIPALPKEFELVDSGQHSDGKYMWRQYQSDDGFVMVNVVDGESVGNSYSTNAENVETHIERINQFDIFFVEGENYIQVVLSDTEAQKHIEITTTVLSYMELKEYVSGIKK